MSTSLRQLTNRIEDLYIDSPHSTPDIPTPPSRRVKSIGTPHSPPSSPIPSTSTSAIRIPSTPSPVTFSTSTLTTSPLLRLSTSFPPTEIAVKERDSSADDDTTTYQPLHSFPHSNRASRASSSYNPKQWRTSSAFRVSVEGIVDKLTSLRNPIEDHL